MRELAFCLLAAFASQPAAALDAFQVEVTRSPSKPAMILIPGLASSGAVWNDTVARYRDRFECHVLTLSGFAGVSLAQREPGMLARVRSELAQYIRTQKLNRPTLVGHSLGGVLALWLAASEPGLAGDLVIVDSLPNLGALFGPDFDPKPMRDLIANQAPAEYRAFVNSGRSLQGMTNQPGRMESIKQWSLDSDQWAVANAMFELYTLNLIPELPKIRSRALVLGSWSGMKAFTTREVVEKNFRSQFASLAGHHFALADTAFHFIMYDEPKWFWEQLDAFLFPANGNKGQ